MGRRFTPPQGGDGGGPMKVIIDDKIPFIQGQAERVADEVVYLPGSKIGPDDVRDADALIVRTRTHCNRQLLEGSQVRFIATATIGLDHLDTDYLEKRGIPWNNAAGYSTEPVAQHTFALLFYLLEKLSYYDHFVKSGKYSAGPNFTNVDEPYYEIHGKVWGIIGLGTIGRRVAGIAEAFGAEVIYASASGAAPQEGYHQVSLDELYERSDIISIHAPLNQYTENLINKNSLSKMKKSCILLNLGRGPIVVEKDLKEALEQGQIAAAGLDVLVKEPMDEKNPLLEIQDSRRLLITPHIAWASMEARERLMKIVYENICTFLDEMMD